MKKQLFLFFASMCTVASVYAQPSISNVNGTVADGNSITISGADFGTKSIAAPRLWDAVDNQPGYAGLSEGDVIPTTSTDPWIGNVNVWAQDYVRYTEDDNRGTRTAHYTGQGNKMFLGWPRELGGKSPPSDQTELYVTWWYKPSQDPGSEKGSNKFIRIWDESNGNDTRISWTHHQLTYEGMTHSGWHTWTEDGNVGEWNRMEIWVSADEGKIRTYINLIETVWWNSAAGGAFDVDDFDKVDNNIGLNIGIIGFDHGNSDYENMTNEISEIYADVTRARVELGNASTWAACTHREIQIPSAWASGSVSVTVNQGAFAPGQPVYLYVVDANGNVNSTGYPLSIAGSTHTITSSAGTGGSIAPGGTLQVSGGTDQSYTITADSGYEIEDVTVDGVSQGAVSSYTFADVQTDHTISVNFTAIGGDIIVDNGGSGTSQSGSWGSSVHYPGYYGSNYLYAPNVSGHWYEWATALSGGTYEVYAWWTAVSGRPADVIYDITHSGGTANITADQTANGGQWNLLGTYTFGSTGLVRLNSSPNGPEGACADAIKFVAAPVEENLALNKAVTVSGEPESANPGTSAVDGEETTRWSVAGAYPQWLEVDLGAVYDINATELVCYQDRAYQFTVDVKTTAGGAYTQVVDRTSNTQGGSAANPIRDDFTKVEARYVRITATGAHQYSGDWTSFREFRVFGTNASSTNSSAGTPVTIEGLSVERANREEGMKVFFNPNELEVYYSPDPAADDNEKALVGVYDKNGQLIEQFSTDAGSLRTGVICDSSQWGEGLYIVRISTAKASFSTKVMLIRR